MILVPPPGTWITSIFTSMYPGADARPMQTGHMRLCFSDFGMNPILNTGTTRFHALLVPETDSYPVGECVEQIILFIILADPKSSNLCN